LYQSHEPQHSDEGVLLATTILVPISFLVPSRCAKTNPIPFSTKNGIPSRHAFRFFFIKACAVRQPDITYNAPFPFSPPLSIWQSLALLFQKGFNECRSLFHAKQTTHFLEGV
jgi:hypothetical protein